MARYYQNGGGLGYTSAFNPAEGQNIANLMREAQAQSFAANAALASREGELASLPTYDPIGKQGVIDEFQGGVKTILDKYGNDAALAAPELARYTAKQRNNQFFEFNRQQLEAVDRFNKQSDRLGNRFYSDVDPREATFQDYLNNPRSLQFQTADLGTLDEITRTQGSAFSKRRISEFIQSNIKGAPGYLKAIKNEGFTEKTAQQFLNSPEGAQVVRELIESQGLNPDDPNLVARTTQNLNASLIGGRKSQFLGDKNFVSSKERESNYLNLNPRPGFSTVATGSRKNPVSTTKDVQKALSSMLDEGKSLGMTDDQVKNTREYKILEARRSNAEDKILKTKEGAAIMEEIGKSTLGLDELKDFKKFDELNKYTGAVPMFLEDFNKILVDKLPHNREGFLKETMLDITEPEIKDLIDKYFPEEKGFTTERSREDLKLFLIDKKDNFEKLIYDKNMGGRYFDLIDEELALNSSVESDIDAPTGEAKAALLKIVKTIPIDTFIPVSEDEEGVDKEGFSEEIKNGEIVDFITVDRGGGNQKPLFKIKVKDTKGKIKTLEVEMNSVTADEKFRELAFEANDPELYYQQKYGNTDIVPNVPLEASEMFGEGAVGSIEELDPSTNSDIYKKFGLPSSQILYRAKTSKGNLIYTNKGLLIDQLAKDNGLKTVYDDYIRDKYISFMTGTDFKNSLLPKLR